MLVRFMAIVLMFIVVSGCGTSPDKAVYDTKDNPLFFPSAALTLIDNVEGGSILGLDSVIDAFTVLYTQHPDLLDNENWRSVVGSLGSKFRYQGDQLTDKGLEFYNEAYGQFLLAAFARPDDPLVQSSASLFAVWPKAIADSIFPAKPDSTWIESLDIYQRIDILKYFVFGDSISRAFAREYVVKPLMTHFLHRDSIATQLRSSMTDYDRAFLASLDLVSFADIRPPASWSEPNIDMLAYQLTSLGPSLYRAEVYLRPKESLPESVKVALWINPDDSATNPSGANASFVPFNFLPDLPSQKWKKGKVVGLGHAFTYQGTIAKISVGLFVENDKRARYFDLTGSGGQLIKLSPIVDTPATR